MGTKRKSSEGAVSKPAAKLPPKRKVVAKPAAVEAAVKPKARKPVAAKAEPTKTAIVKPPGPATAVIATENVALRAYFISEKRVAEGRAGDSLTDWLEAERQLLAEQLV